MKRFILLSLAVFGLAALSSCNKSEAAPELVTYEISVDASLDAPADEPATKALRHSMRMLYCFWATGDVVTVYKDNTAIGTLSPNGHDASSSLKGTITTSALTPGTELRLLAPKQNWLYGNQDGTFSTVSSKYSYSMATVAVTAVNGNNVSTEPATFKNQQAIIEFKFLDGSGNQIYPETLKIEAASGKIVKSIAANMSVMYGNLEIETEEEVSDFFVALRNDSGKEDTYTLTATVGNTNYIATKSGVLFENGKFYSGTVTMQEETHTYTVAGSPGSVFGTEWEPSLEKNDMVKQSDGTYKKTYTLTAEKTDLAFKVVKDHAWTYAWPASNYTCSAGKGTLTIIFNPSTEEVTATYPEPPAGYKDTYTVAGNPASVFGTVWDPTNTANDMIEQSDGTYAITYKSVPGGTELAFKVAVNHSWSLDYGAGGVVGGPNVTHTMSATKNLTISFNPSTHIISATEN